MTRLHHDYETRSEIDLKKRGLDVYSSHPSTKVLMCAYSFDDGPEKLWLPGEEDIPAELEEALLDPHVEKWAFNAQFERIIARRVLKIPTPYEGWRCAMVLAMMQSFVGGLEQIGKQMGLPQDQQKLSEGKRLIKKFCGPHKPTKANPHRWRNELTDPEDWELFCEYCKQDVVAEKAIYRPLIKFPIPPEEWELYELDQLINDRGLPLDMQFVRQAMIMYRRRSAELTHELRELTGVANPNSIPQLLPWLKDRGYPFSDLKKDTVKKVLTENEEAESGGFLDEEAIDCLKLRQQAARISVKKYDALDAKTTDGVLRNGFQFGGAARTNRWAGRIINPQNLTRTPKALEPDGDMAKSGVADDFLLTEVTRLIREGDYDGLKLMVDEPMDALAGTVRSAISVWDSASTYALLACDLSSIETVVIAWLSGCERLLNVFRTGKDAYKDFGVTLYNKPYEAITKFERQMSKPAVLGAGYRLGGGDLKEGKRTGLWGYAESLGVNMTKEESHKAVRLYREAYPEIPQLWYALEEAVERCIRTGRDSVPIIKLGSRTFRVPVKFEWRKPYLAIVLPVVHESGQQRRMYYYKPRIQKVTRIGRDGESYTKKVFTYMGQIQNTRKWARIESHGGKITENIVQALARDILAVGLRRADEYGFNIRGHVHDEIIALIRRGDNYYTKEALIQCMTAPIKGLEGLPLGAAGSIQTFYRKD